MDFSLMFFASGDGSGTGESYRLVFEGARFADNTGFKRIWLPERHFVPFGAVHPNPSILASALARETKQVRLAAGSIVLPLHDPLRVAEEWAVVDNISEGRVDLSFASGWHPNDFALAPNNYQQRHRLLAERVDLIRHLWRGEFITAASGDGRNIQIRTYPTPIQPVLPVWITAARNPKTFRLAGQLGANVLTYLVDLGREELNRCLVEYREGRRDGGYDPTGGIVTLMLHTFVGEDLEVTRSLIRPHYCAYLRSNSDLLSAAVTALHRSINLDHISHADLDTLVCHQFDRVFQQLSFMGSISSCVELAHDLAAIGVTEIACLIDFVSDAEQVLAALPALTAVKDQLQAPAVGWEPAATRFFPSDATPLVTTTDGANQPLNPLQTDSDQWSPDGIRSRLVHQMTGHEFYQHLRQLGGEYGPYFQVIEQLWFNESEVLALIRCDEGQSHDRFAYGLDPAVLDNCLSTLIASSLTPIHRAADHSFGLPDGFDCLSFDAAPSPQLWSHATRRPTDGSNHFVGDVRVYTSDGRLVVQADGLRFGRLSTRTPVTGLPDAPAYCIEWKALALETLTHQAQPLHWLIVSNDKKAAQTLQTELLAQSTNCRVVWLQDLLVGTRTMDTKTAQIEPEAWQQMFQERVLADRLVLPDAWCLLLTDCPIAGDADDQVQRLEDIVALVLGLARAIASAQNLTDETQLILMTQGGQVLPIDQASPVPWASVVWGVARTLSVEQPSLNIRLIDLDPNALTTCGVASLASVLIQAKGERELALRDGQVWCPQLTPLKTSAGAKSISLGFTPRRDVSYLITGGTGALGLTLSTWLVLQGARHLILVSRRDAASGKDKSAHPVALGLANLERLGAQIYCRTVDVADRDGLKAALDTSFRDGCPPLGGIFHLAGTLHDAAFTSLDRQAIAQVLHPKCGGILALHQLTEGQDLDLFVTFSSLAALVGSHGQSAYTAANAFLDAFSEYRRVQGLASITINWGPWSDQGMAASPEVAKQLAHTGIDWLDITTALAGLSAVLSQDVSPVVIAASDWQQLTTQLRGQPASPLLAKLVNNGTQAASDSSPLMLNDLVDHLLPLSPEAQQAWVEDQIIQMIAEIAELDSTQIQPDAEVTAIGLDSLMAMEMRSEMQSRYGINVPINKLLERRSIANLAVELLSSLLISLTAKQDIAEVVSVEENEVIEI